MPAVADSQLTRIHVATLAPPAARDDRAAGPTPAGRAAAPAIAITRDSESPVTDVTGHARVVSAWRHAKAGLLPIEGQTTAASPRLTDERKQGVAAQRLPT